MDLQPLYEVQERLEHAAVAGTGILNEDFRLKRAREGLAPLAAASPVFAKISAGLEALLAAPPEKRGGALLDVLALVDAVVYTQASAGMAGELEPLPHGVGTCQEVSYGQLRPLLEALTGTGGGRYNLIKEAFANHPEYFADYRVIPALVAGLGDSYGELADLNADILGRQGPGILPLLEAGFDPAGGRGMARRVEVMSRAAGAQANDFFLAQLPQAKKEIRLAIIDALGCQEANAPLLLELCRTERKGVARDLAHRALARLNRPEGEAYLAEQADHDPDQMLEILGCLLPSGQPSYRKNFQRYAGADGGRFPGCTASGRVETAQTAVPGVGGQEGAGNLRPLPSAGRPDAAAAGSAGGRREWETGAAAICLL